MLRKEYYFFFLVILTFIFFPFASRAIEIEGIGAEPAYPDPEIEHSDLYFIYNLDREETKKDGIKIFNISDKSIKVKLYPVDAVVTMRGIFNPLLENAPRKDIGSWIELSVTKVTLEPKEERIIPFTITIPENAKVGDHLGALVVEKDEPPRIEKTETVTKKIKQRLAIRVYETVPGEIKEILKISDVFWKIGFKKLSPQPTVEERIKTILGLRKVWIFALELKNEGNICLDPVINIEITNTFGSRIDILEDASLGTTQPGGTIFIPIEWSKPPIFGRLTAHINIFYGEGKKTSTEVLSFWMIPWTFITIAVLLIIIGIFIRYFWKLFYLIKKERKK